MSEPIRIANCSGFFGDRLAAAREMVEGGPIDVLTGDWLAELTMLILAAAEDEARQRLCAHLHDSDGAGARHLPRSRHPHRQQCRRPRPARASATPCGELATTSRPRRPRRRRDRRRPDAADRRPRRRRRGVRQPRHRRDPGRGGRPADHRQRVHRGRADHGGSARRGRRRRHRPGHRRRPRHRTGGLAARLGLRRSARGRPADAGRTRRRARGRARHRVRCAGDAAATTPSSRDVPGLEHPGLARSPRWPPTAAP